MSKLINGFLAAYWLTAIGRLLAGWNPDKFTIFTAFLATVFCFVLLFLREIDKTN